METMRSASRSTLSWALLEIVRVSTMTSETPKTAMTTSTTARVELMRRRRTVALRAGDGELVRAYGP